jgi:CHAT domain-containing protein
VKSFTRLLYSAQEAAYILKLVPPSHALQAVGSDANREVVFSSRIARYDILHFATHVSINREDPELNSLVLSLFDLQGRPRDGWIRAYELPSLTLSADLVVLSGCDTAIGSEEQGEGLRSLSRQFLEIGVPRVVASRFPVSDRATAEFMAFFYTHLLRGDRPPSQALRLAQVEMARSEEWKDSFQWAAFSLTGDWR